MKLSFEYPCPDCDNNIAIDVEDALKKNFVFCKNCDTEIPLHEKTIESFKTALAEFKKSTTNKIHKKIVIDL